MELVWDYNSCALPEPTETNNKSHNLAAAVGSLPATVTTEPVGCRIQSCPQHVTSHILSSLDISVHQETGTLLLHSRPQSILASTGT